MLESHIPPNFLMQKSHSQLTESAGSLRRMYFPEQKDLFSPPLLKKKRSRRFSELDFPKVQLPMVTQETENNEESEVVFDTQKQPQIDRFLDLVTRHKRDFAVAKAIHRKISTNAFFQENKDLFEYKLDREASIYLCQKMSLETYRENEIIYEKDEGTDGKIYLIYKGEIGIFLAKEAPSIGFGLGSQDERLGSDIWGTRLIPKLTRQSSSLLERLNEEKEEESLMENIGESAISIGKKRRRIMDPYCGLHVSKILRNEEYFGTEAMDESKQRQETMVAKTETHLLIIKAEDLEYVKYRYEKERVNRLEFLLESLSLSYELEKKNQLFSHLTEKTYSFGHVFLSEGNPGNSVYFICKGKCEVQKKSEDPPSAIPTVKTPAAAHFRRDFTIGVVEEGTFIGEETLFGQSPKYDYSVRVATPKAHFFMIEASVLLKILTDDTVKKIKEIYVQKAIKYHATFEKISNEFNKMSLQASMIPSAHKPRCSIFASLETSWRKGDLLSTKEGDREHKKVLLNKPRFSLQIGSNLPLIPSDDTNSAKRNSLKPFCHQPISASRQERAEFEVSSNAQPKPEDPISSFKITLPIGDDTSRSGSRGPDSAKNRVARTSSFYTKYTEASSSDASPKVGTPRKMVRKVDKPVDAEKPVRLDFGNIKKVPNWYSYTQPSSPAAASKKKMRSSSSNRKKGKELAVEEQNLITETLEAKFRNFPHLSLQNYLEMCKKSANKVWSPRYQEPPAGVKVLELKKLKKVPGKDKKALSARRYDSIDQDNQLVKGVALRAVQARPGMRLPSHGWNVEVVTRNTDR